MKIKLKPIIFLTLIFFFLQGCYTINESMFFNPIKLEQLSGDFDFNEVYFRVKDTIAINAWYLTKDSADAVILLLHGNARNLYSPPWINIINSLSKLNINVFAIDYRGFGRSSGYPSFRGIYQDAEEALNYLQQHNPQNKPIIIYGLSMGAIPAVRIASKPGVSGLILEGAISSSQDALEARRAHNWLLNLVKLKYDKYLEFDLSQEIQNVKSPVFIMHGKNDYLPELMPLKVFNSVTHAHKHYWLVEKGNHCDTYKIEPQQYNTKLSSFIDECKSLK